jgi:hypothetical protein
MLLYSPTLLSNTSPDPGWKRRVIAHPSEKALIQCVN